MKDIRDKLVLVTGGASGIGRLMSFNFARRGARVIIWDINGGQIQEVETEAAAEGITIKGMICDVSDRETVYRQAERLIAEYGPLYMLINNAGIVSGRPLLETPDEKIIRSININMLSLFWTTKAFLPGMIERDSGHLVTISSAAGLIGVTGLADYSTSKFGVFGFHEAMRMELRRRKSRINTTVICPFFIDTGMFQGVKTRIPLLLPILKSDYAARRIVKAVLNNRQRLIMPSFVKSIFLLRLLPTFMLDAVADFMGISNSMDEYIGRQQPRAAGTPAEAGTPAGPAAANLPEKAK
jgi:all-trans-retinol dehydrogenase (NAD+)